MLSVGDPFQYASDVCPAIDVAAQDALDAHEAARYRNAKFLVELRLPYDCHHGTFITPAMSQIGSIKDLEKKPLAQFHMDSFTCSAN